MQSPCSLCVYHPYQILNASTNLYETRVRISWNLSSSQRRTSQIPLISLGIPTVIARQRLSRHTPVTMNIRNNRIIIGGIVFYTVCVVS
jgi:hypothetical protein